ncbi:hypothetical protein Nepgr_028329 [Nepenthes gracilis]|uniref:Protein NRT1/ PTR FAMILY 5.5-like n=1 Tax=Nepenthes gracilis TaxID=150966 RepID=A0AAD3TC96_NEPGR|nr:hypothetical protein Nepgr_028329 [Nepenthes gracilis]
MWMTMTYLTNVWKLDYTRAAGILNLWGGLVQILPIGLAHLADAFMGNFCVLLFSTVSYSVGLGLLAMSTPPVLAKHTGTCTAYRPECIGHEQKLLFYVGLALLAVGMGGHFTTLGGFAAEQMEEGVDEDEEEANIAEKISIFLSVFAMVSIPIAGIIAIPYIKPWSVRYGIAAIFTLVSLLVFLTGICSYKYVGPRGSPLTTTLRVFLASTSKIFYSIPKDKSQLHEKPNLPEDEQLTHTRGFRCLDKAAIIIPNQELEQQQKNRWRLCGVTEIEETKIVLRMIPMWLTFIICGVVSSIGNTYFLEQANHMNRKVGKLKVPLPVLLWFYDQGKQRFAKLYFAVANSMGESGARRYAPPVGIAMAMVFSVLCCITAAKVEARRLGVVNSHGLVDKPDDRIPMSIFWLLPQFVLLGALDGIYENSIECFMVDQAPPSMVRYLGILTGGVFGTGVIGSVLSVYVVGKISEKGGKPNWFQSTLNKSRLDNYYWVLAGLSAINLVAYVVVAISYAYRESRSEDMEASEDDETDDDSFDDNARCCCCC